MTKEQSRKIAEKAVGAAALAAAEYVRNNEEHPPLLLVETADGKLDAIHLGPLFTDAGGKSAAASIHRAAGGSPSVRYSLMVTEAWMHSGRSDDQVARAIVSGQVSVSQLEGRREIVLFNCIAGGHQWLCVREIDRAARALLPGELMSTEGGDAKFEGRMIGRDD
jgi:hypothetical protein